VGKHQQQFELLVRLAELCPWEGADWGAEGGKALKRLKAELKLAKQLNAYAEYTLSLPEKELAEMIEQHTSEDPTKENMMVQFSKYIVKEVTGRGPLFLFEEVAASSDGKEDTKTAILSGEKEESESITSPAKEKDADEHEGASASPAPKLKFIKFADYLMEDQFEQLAKRDKLLRELVKSDDDSKKSKPKKIAIIYVDGSIGDDADKVRKAVRLASKDKKVAAIVLRVSSPGGGVIESEYIWRAVSISKVPVVASFGNVSASGGYYVSAPAARIFADRSTITGSIGVIFVQFNAKELAEKLGINVDFVQRGKNAVHFSGGGVVQDWPPELEKKFNFLIDASYQEFVSKVAEGRHQEYDAIHQIAKGRVWSGASGLKLGLVDEIGGMKQAVESAKTLGGIYPFEEAEVVVYPARSIWKEILDVDKVAEEELAEDSKTDESGSAGGESSSKSSSLSGAGISSAVADIVSENIGVMLQYMVQNSTVGDSLKRVFSSLQRQAIQGAVESTLGGSPGDASVRAVMSPEVTLD